MPSFSAINEFLNTKDLSLAHIKSINKTIARACDEVATRAFLAKLEQKFLDKTLQSRESIVLGLYYQHGDVITKHYNKAYACYLSANNSLAQMLMAEIYFFVKKKYGFHHNKMFDNLCRLYMKKHKYHECVECLHIAVEDKDFILTLKLSLFLLQHLEADESAAIFTTIYPQIETWVLDSDGLYLSTRKEGRDIIRESMSQFQQVEQANPLDKSSRLFFSHFIFYRRVMGCGCRARSWCVVRRKKHTNKISLRERPN